MKSKLITGKVLLGVLYISIAVAILVAVMFVVPIKTVQVPRVFLGGEEIKVTVADTPDIQEQGLSGKKELKADEGMLFIFSNPGTYGFWMKDMLFPIDIIWFDSNRKIVDEWQSARPESYPKIHAPRDASQYVLEVQAGFFASHVLKNGDILELDLPARYNR